MCNKCGKVVSEPACHEISPGFDYWPSAILPAHMELSERVPLGAGPRYKPKRATNS